MLLVNVDVQAQQQRIVVTPLPAIAGFQATIMCEMVICSF